MTDITVWRRITSQQRFAYHAAIAPEPASQLRGSFSGLALVPSHVKPATSRWYDFFSSSDETSSSIEVLVLRCLCGTFGFAAFTTQKLERMSSKPPKANYQIPNITAPDHQNLRWLCSTILVCRPLCSSLSLIASFLCFSQHQAPLWYLVDIADNFRWHSWSSGCCFFFKRPNGHRIQCSCKDTKTEQKAILKFRKQTEMQFLRRFITISGFPSVQFPNTLCSFIIFMPSLKDALLCFMIKLLIW